MKSRTDGLSTVSPSLASCVRNFEMGTLEIYHYFPASVPFLQISNSLRDLTQCVTPVDNWSHLPGFHEFAQRGQVLFAYFGDHHGQFLSHEPRQHKRFDHAGHETDHPPPCRSSDHNVCPGRTQDPPAG